jgi:hypothetical protein
MLQRGRLWPVGAFQDPGLPKCPDSSVKTAALGAAGPAARGDVDDLIRNKRVRSIELRASKQRRKLGPLDIATPGAVFENIAASGTYSASWKVKLTRIPRR